jgi:hypothetical protein
MSTQRILWDFPEKTSGILQRSLMMVLKERPRGFSQRILWDFPTAHFRGKKVPEIY